MPSPWDWIVENVVVGVVLVGVVALVCRWTKRHPALCHTLWLIVLVRLVAPPIPPLSKALNDWSPLRDVRDVVTTSWQGDDESMAKEYEVGLIQAYAAESSSSRSPRSVNEASRHRPTTDQTSPDVTPAVHVDAVETDDAAAAVMSSSSWWTRTKSRVDITDVLLGLWIIGSAVVFLRRLSGLRKLHRFLARTEVAPTSLIRSVRDVAKDLDVRLPRIRVVDGLGTPFVSSLGRPILVWPKSLDADDARGVVTHELAHLRRRDHWVGWFESMVSIVFWWNPLVHFARRQVRRYAELAADAWAVNARPDQRRTYAETVIGVAGGLTPRGIAVTGMGPSDRRTLELRLSRIMQGSSPRVPAAPMMALLAILVAGLPLGLGVSKASESSFDERLDKQVERRVASAIDRTQGRRLLAANHADRATQRFRRILERGDPCNADFVALVRAELKARRPQAALAVASELEARAGQGAPGALLVGVCHLERGRSHIDDARDALDRARRFGLTAVRLDAECAVSRRWNDHRIIVSLRREVRETDRLRRLAKRKFDEADFAAVVEVAREVVSRVPFDGAARHALAVGLLSVDKIARADEAERECRRQIELGYRVATGHYNIACARARRGDLDGAFEALQSADTAGLGWGGPRAFERILHDPDLDALRSDARFDVYRQFADVGHRSWQHAKAAFDAKRWAEAADRIGRILEAGGSDDPAHWAMLGRSRLRLGQAAEAATAVRNGVRAGLDAGEGLTLLAAIRFGAGEVDEAFERLEQAVAAGVESVDLDRFTELDALRRHERYAMVRQEADKARELAMFSATSWIELEARARRNLARGPRDDKSFGPSWLCLGWALLRQGMFEQAVEAFERQEKAGHDVAIAIYNIACCHARRGDTEQALRELDRAVAIGFDDTSLAMSDPDLARIRSTEQFQSLVNRMRKDASSDALLFRGPRSS